MKISCADIGPICPVGVSPIERWVVIRDIVVHHSEIDEELGDIEESL